MPGNKSLDPEGEKFNKPNRQGLPGLYQILYMETVIIREIGCRVDDVAFINEQLWIAHQAYNEGVAIVHKALADCEALVIRHSQEGQKLDVQIRALGEAFAKAKAANDEPEMERIAKERRALRGQFWEAVKPVRKALKTELAAIRNAAIGQRSTCATYQACYTQAVAKGLHTETALRTHKALLQATDKVLKEGGRVSFRKAAERLQDHVAVRFTAAGGVPVEKLRTENGLFWIDGVRTFERGKPRATFRMRMGSAESGRYATGTMKADDLPEGARVTTIRLVRRKVADMVKWALQFELTLQDVPAIETTSRLPMAVLHFGWDLNETGARRIGAVSEDGHPEFVQYLTFPDKVLEDVARAEAFKRERDKLRDDFVPYLKTLSGNGLDEAGAELLKATQRLPAQHISQKRIGQIHWAFQRSSLGEIEKLKEFVRADKWLRLSERSIDRKARNARKTWYQGLALDLVKRYECLVICKPDLQDAALRIKDDGKRNELGQIARKARHDVAISEFTQALKWAALRAGAVVLEAEDAKHVNECSACGAEVKRDFEMVSCECGLHVETKANSAARLWQVCEPSFAQAAQAAKAAMEKAATDRKEKQGQRLALQQAKRREVRASAGESAEVAMV